MVVFRRYALWVRLAVLLGVAAAGLALSTTQLITPRIDLTTDKAFTLSQGTRDMLAQLEQPVELWWFHSERQLREAPSLRNYALRVESLLTEMTRLAGGKLRLRRVDPAPFSVDEDRATQWGLQAVPVEAGQPALYLGLAAIGANGNEEVIPFLHPNRQRFLEYDVARAIARSARVRPPTIGLISSLPVKGGVDTARRTVHRPWTALRDTEQDPFAGAANIRPAEGVVPWTDNRQLHAKRDSSRICLDVTFSPSFRAAVRTLLYCCRRRSLRRSMMCACDPLGLLLSSICHREAQIAPSSEYNAPS